MGWIGSERPKMVAVQSSGCAPIVKAWDEGKPSAEFWPHASTLAAGLRVPKAYGDYLILDILRKSAGAALAVSDIEIMDALRHWGRVEGIFAAPEGAASLAAYRKLRDRGFFAEDDKVVLFNTGSGLKYLDVIEGEKRKSGNAAGLAPDRRHHRAVLSSAGVSPAVARASLRLRSGPALPSLLRAGRRDAAGTVALMNHDRTSLLSRFLPL